MATAAPKAVPQARTVEPTFVFGADLSGDFAGPTASVAQKHFRADSDIGVGPSGGAYAIPYRDSAGALLGFGALSPHIQGFLAHARAHPEEVFLVARFGCEPGALGDVDMARQFTHLPPNVLLQGLWQRANDPKFGVRLLIFDPFARFKEEYWQVKLKRFLSLNAATCNGGKVELVSVGPARSVVANDQCARKLGFKHRVFGANEANFGKDAQTVADMKAMWYSTHFLSLCDFKQTVQPQQFRFTTDAIRAGLTVEQLENELD
ncbi:MAG: hypothetical protein AB7I01_23505 [Gammaproteobacteria bacterium]